MSEKEYIERDAVVRMVHGYCHTIYGTVCGPDDVVELYEELKSIPAADVVKVRHGRWLPDYDYTEYDFDGSTPLLEPRKFQDGWQCSLCGQYEPSETKYCSNCGAKMDAEEAEAT